MPWSSGLRRLTGDAKVEGSNPNMALISFGKIVATLHPGTRYRMRKFMWLDAQVCACKMATKMATKMAGMLPREWKMCIHCVRVSLNPMTGVIIYL